MSEERTSHRTGENLHAQRIDPLVGYPYARARKALLICGILSSLLYVGTDRLAAALWTGYSSTSQTVSELIAIDAPARPLVVPLFFVYSLLIFAFGCGVFMSATDRPPLRIAAILIITKEILGLVVTLFFPIHLRGVEATLSDTMHGTLTAAGVFLCMFPAMGFAAAAFGKQFRIYTIATMLAFVVFGVLAGLDGPRLASNLQTPWMGLWERINIYGYMLWIGVFTIVLVQMGESKGN